MNTPYLTFLSMGLGMGGVIIVNANVCLQTRDFVKKYRKLYLIY